jgi:squalene-associated FAD-dependent desaturase
MTPRVVVVGGGLAGITAAVGCADAGAQVTLLEGRPRLGGLTHSFRRGDLWVDNGQHVFLRCCTAYRGLLERLGVAHLTTLQPRLDIPVHGAGRTGRLRRGRLPAPLHLAGTLAAYPWLGPRQRAAVVRGALALRHVDRDVPSTDAMSFGQWLRAHGQPPEAIDSVWDLVGLATLNARADDVSLGLAATVFQLGLLTDRDAADIGWSLVPLQQLHGDAAVRSLGAAGADVRTSTKVRGLGHDGDRWVVHTDEGDRTADGVVLAVPPTEAERILPPAAVSASPGWSAALGSAAIVNLHVVLDRHVLDEPFVATIDGDLQWVFDRTRQCGLRTGQCLAVSLSAADDLVDLPTAALRGHFWPQLTALLPGLGAATVLDFFVTRERHATFRPAPGSRRHRPQPATSLSGLTLAGAWVDTGWPATMEGAVRSGEAATRALLPDLSTAPRGAAV